MTRADKTVNQVHFGSDLEDFQMRIRINPDPDPNVCQIAAKMDAIRSLVGLSHFAKCCKNRPVTVWEMLINLLKSPIPQW